MRPSGNRWHGRACGPLLARTCTKCHEFRQADEFYDFKGGVCDKNPKCKQCVVRDSGTRSKARSARRKEAGLRGQRSAQHGMSDEEFLAFTARGRCDACGATSPGSSRSWHVDHDHACCPTPKSQCGKCIRGLLCHFCNVTLGMAHDKPDRLLALLAYMRNRVLQHDDPSKELMGMSANGN